MTIANTLAVLLTLPPIRVQRRLELAIGRQNGPMHASTGAIWLSQSNTCREASVHNLGEGSHEIGGMRGAVIL
jgi:hypothetical protein